MKTIAVCIINYNTRDLLRACLQSVLLQNADEILVVDNASTDGSVDMVRTEFSSIRVLRLEKNIGFGAASNRGIENCRSEHIFLLNADAMMLPGSLQSLNKYLEVNKHAAMIGPRVLNPDGTLQTSCFHYPTPLHIFLYISGIYKFIPRIPVLRKHTLQKVAGDSAMAVPWILGAALAFRRETFESLGGFDETFFLYFEEVDLCYRMSVKGQQIHYMPESEIIHVGGASTVQQRARFYLMFFASLAEFYRKHYSKFLLIQLVIIVKFFALFRMARDFLLLQTAKDATKQSDLKTNLTIYQDLVFGHWDKRAGQATAVPA
jgi:GT2 family glycosyltransferase